MVDNYLRQGDTHNQDEKIKRSTKRKYSIKDYTGDKIGSLTILCRYELSEDDTAITAKWEAVCDCGEICVISHKQVSGRKKTTCGCGIRNPRYLPGNKFNLLTIVREGPKVEYSNGSKVRQVWCSCECGNPELTLVRTSNLTSGNTTSCGCIGRERRRTHGMSNTRTYQIWEGMKRRCRPDLKEMFPHHAGKGVTYCSKWETFEGFYEDMGPAPDDMSLDRIDFDGNYEKSNCRWASSSVQGYNKGIDPNNTSGRTGVSWYSHAGVWSSEIHVDGKHLRLGTFSRFEDAVRAREKAELEYYGWNKE